MEQRTEALYFVVSGRVQGVAFRAFARREAEARSLVGWVANTPEGTVEGVVAGGAAEVDELVGLLSEGPVAARVTDVRTEPLTLSQELPPGFHVR